MMGRNRSLLDLDCHNESMMCICRNKDEIVPLDWLYLPSISIRPIAFDYIIGLVHRMWKTEYLSLLF